jgi:hypothetical protein
VTEATLSHSISALHLLFHLLLLVIANKFVSMLQTTSVRRRQVKPPLSVLEQSANLLLHLIVVLARLERERGWLELRRKYQRQPRLWLLSLPPLLLHQPLPPFNCRTHCNSIALLPLGPSFNLHNRRNSMLILRPLILIKPELSLRCHIKINPSNLLLILIFLWVWAFHHHIITIPVPVFSSISSNLQALPNIWGHRATFYLIMTGIVIL